MKKFVLAILMTLMAIEFAAQPNCNVFFWQGDTLQYKACKLSEKFEDYYQYDMRAIAILDSCLAICPYYPFAHYEYGVVYLKAGNFVEWDRYINMAVQYDPENYLGLRASCRAKFFGDYEGAIHDIDLLDTIIEYDIGFVHDGAYHLDAYKALCYKAINNSKMAIELFEKHLVKNEKYIGLFDYIHLGVAYQNMGNHTRALESFSQQESLNNIAENNYYKALSYLEMGDLQAFDKYIKIAEAFIIDKKKMFDGFHVMEDEIFMSDIQKLKELADSKR